jgi:hypothetical protein
MDDPSARPRRAFFKSPHHAVMTLATLGAGFVTAEPLYLLLGATAYTLGWIYLPDMKFFRKWLTKQQMTADASATSAEVAAFVQRRDAMVASLQPKLREEYYTLARVCREIEKATAADELSGDARLRKLDELMWMFLRLLTIEQSLVMYLETEKSEPLPQSLAEAERQVAALSDELEKMRQSGAVPEHRERLFNSKKERLEVLRKRLERLEEAEANLEVVRAEQERLTEQIKLIRADAVASKNTEALSARISASVSQLNETNKWLSEMDQFKDLAEEPPLPARRVGFGTAAPPPIPAKGRARTAQS